MDGSFACPECGSDVEAAGIAPGRQVRCAFCNRLLEVPFLPRSASPPWKRPRFKRPQWFFWACAGLGVAFIAIVGTGAVRFVSRQYDSAQQRSIKQLLDSSKAHEADGQLDQALIDLDTALEMARKAGPTYISRVEDWAQKRPELARREAQSVVDRLRTADPSSFHLGYWLSLIARSEKDADLSPMTDPIRRQFLADLERQSGYELSAARQLADSRQTLKSFAICERIATLIDHLPPDKAGPVRAETLAIVDRLLSQHGMRIENPRGNFVFGAKSYTSGLVPVVAKAFEKKGYLPYRASSPWQAEWKHARFVATIVVSETLQESYMASSNRLTRIELKLTVTTADQRSLVFQTTPRAKSQTLLPNLPVHLSNKIAMSGERSDEVEKLLYDNARDQIDGMLGNILKNLKECPP